MAVNYSILSYICTTSSLSTHVYLFIRHCVHVLATVTSTPMNIRGPCIFLNDSFVCGCTQEWDCCIAWQFCFWFFGASPCHFSQWLCQVTFPPTVQKASLSSAPSIAFAICKLLNDGHADWCEQIPHYSFDLHFSDDWQFGVPLQVTLSY